MAPISGAALKEQVQTTLLVITDSKRKYRMNLQKISNETILNVSAGLMAYRDVQWFRANAALPFIQKLNEEELGLLSFVQYFVSLNKVWQKIEESTYYSIPCATVQQATFADFVVLMRHYQGNRISRRNERELIIFLLKNTLPFRDFYMALLTRPDWIRDFFMKKELRGYADSSIINPEDLYSKPTLLSGGFEIISFPFLVTAVPHTDLLPALIYRNGATFKIYSHHIINKQNRSFTRTRVPTSWLKVDRPFIQHTSFVLLGMIDINAGKFYPLDYFDSLQEYARYKHSTPEFNYETRVGKLCKFLESSFLRQIQKAPIVLCQYAKELDAAVTQVLTTENSMVLLCDGLTRTYYAPSVEREGVIGGIWTEDAVVKGFEIWYNSKLYKCAFNFTGENTALLYNTKLVINKHIKFHLFTFKTHTVSVAKEILWEQKPYRRGSYKFEDGAEGYIERCPICLRSDTKHYYDGVCQTTWQAWRSMIGSRGVDTWFPVSRKIQLRRIKYGWTADSVNNLRATYKGYKIVANDNGDIMFQSDSVTKAAYDARVAGSYWKDKVKHTSPEVMRQAYIEAHNIGGSKDGSEETGNIC